MWILGGGRAGQGRVGQRGVLLLFFQVKEAQLTIKIVKVESVNNKSCYCFREFVANGPTNCTLLQAIYFTDWLNDADKIDDYFNWASKMSQNMWARLPFLPANGPHKFHQLVSSILQGKRKDSSRLSLFISCFHFYQVPEFIVCLRGEIRWIGSELRFLKYF